MSVRKIIVLLIVILVGVGAGIGYYQYNRAPQSVSSLRATPVTAAALFSKFSTNEPEANQSYLNKALEVSGTVLEVKHNQDKQSQIILDGGDPMFGIACTMDKISGNIKTGDRVVIKGICTGYLNDVILIRSLQLQ